jgi:hypothetical protein
MLVTMIVIAALLAGAATLVALSARATQGAQISRSTKEALFCADSGLAAARDAIANNYPQWNGSLGASVEPAWLGAVRHDIDGDGQPDFAITIRDNDDEAPTDPTRDNDLTVWVVSTCTKYPEARTQVTELVHYNGGGNCYQSQLGGCGGNNNAN